MGGYEYRLCIEVNLTPVEQKRWRQKVRSYFYCLPAYKARFDTDAIVVAVMVASPIDFPRRRTDSPATEEEVLEREREEKRREKRLEDMLHWTELELRELGALHEADLFCFGQITTDSLTPSTLFTDPRFFVPTQEAPDALIPDREMEEVPFG